MSARPLAIAVRCARLALLALLLGCSAAFKDAEMKKCSDLHFCRTNRARASGAEEYFINGKLFSGVGGVMVELMHRASGSRFHLRVAALATGAVRVRVTEPDKARYSPPDVLLAQAEQVVSWANVTQVDANTILLVPHTSDVTYRMTANPFALDMLADNHPVVTLNARQLLHVEPLRDKQAREREGDPEGAWEEKYNSHTDSKPKGPQSLSVDLRFHGAQHLFGLPEHASSFSLRRTRASAPAGGAQLSEPYRLYNLDVYEYLADSPFGLYGSIPVLLAHAPGTAGGGGAPAQAPRTTAAFWLNSAEQYVDISDGELAGSTDAHWWAESGLLDLFLLPGPTPADVWRTYASLTGAPALPARFATGYHQCRWNYKDEADVEAVDAGFDAHDMPYDVIWLDIEHTDGKRYMTWDSRYFPSPARLQDHVASRGRKTVTIIDPHVKRDPDFAMHAEASSKGLYVKSADGTSDFEGWCWPGSSSYLDVTDVKIRDWWAQQFSYAKYVGSTEHLHVWNDMNEPSVFNGPEVTMQKDLVHSGGWEHRDVHNAYGMYYHAATVQGLEERSPRARPFVLSRAFFAGSQRLGAVWTGDNAAEWAHLAVSVPMVLSVSVAGLPFVGADVGGFFGTPQPELAVRWYQLGTYYPFFRGHAHHETQRREPWLFGEPHTTAIRAALRERYALLPYIYTLFAASAGYGSGAGAAWGSVANSEGIQGGASAANASWQWVGTPIARPLWSEFPADPLAPGVEQQLMVGQALMVCPALAEGITQVSCYLPGGPGQRWYDGVTGAPLQGGQTVSAAAPLAGPTPNFVRAGSVLARRERPRRASAAQQGDPFTLLVALDGDGAAQGELYLDDGHSTDYLSGAFSRRLFSAQPGAHKGTWVLRCEGLGAQGFPATELVERIVILGLPPQRKGWSALVQGSGAALEAAPGSASRSDAAAAYAHALVVRAPGVSVGSQWSIVLTPM